MTVLAGVIGDPISRSRSPRLHGHWLHRHGIDGQYVPLHVRTNDLTATLDLLPRLGFAGINVTLPHKEDVFDLADEVSDRARSVRAANTLVFRDGRIIADNTDGLGFVANLRQTAPCWQSDRPAFVIGAGGAARGIVGALLDAGIPRVFLSNRTVSRALSLAETFDDRVTVLQQEQLPNGMASCGLLVNATSLGMSGHSPLLLDLGFLPRHAVVADIVYAPLLTPLLREAGARGHPVVDGLGMLLHQAVPGFAAWFGVTPVVDDHLRRAVLA